MILDKRQVNSKTNERTTQDELILKRRNRQSPSILLFHFISFLTRRTTTTLERECIERHTHLDQTRLEWIVDYVDYEGER